LRQRFVSRKICVYLDGESEKMLEMLRRRLGINNISEIVRLALINLYLSAEKS